MSDRERTTHDKAGESAEERRDRESAREAVEWETAFAAAREQGAGAGPADAKRLLGNEE
jgi:hypothetical protein